MRKVGTLPNQNSARKFAHFMASRKLRTQIEPQSQSDTSAYNVWAIEEDQRHEVAEHLEEYLANPNDVKFKTSAAKVVDKSTKPAPQKRTRFRQFQMSREWDQSIWKRCPTTLTLIVLTGMVTALGFNVEDGIEGFGRQLQPFLTWLYIVPVLEDPESGRDAWIPALGLKSIYLNGQVWRPFTPMFIHFGVFHLLFNLMWLWSLGASIELRRGWWRLLIFILAVAGVSNLMEFWFDCDLQEGLSGILRYDPSPFFGGMSGVNYGLFGFIWIRARLVPRSGFMIHDQTVFLLLIWLVACTTGMIGPVANVAHIMGLLMGMAVGALPLIKLKSQTR
ncbi:rhomboid family intramembrane serine protease [Calycomorphotria hydatis]|uniref:Rhomboid protease GlpG n=1 Tax=Calycomorphotria hydatis TaxID=2528027 RepID=A0A517T7F2_9PLAN|nr:rhomboid family intramembrane serine protease [Calycomorphotria hydatis]QDT64297.1 Rhomboid protease GlpG [Calycomorphotria hydatis]